MAETLCLNTTVTSFNLGDNGRGKGGGQMLYCLTEALPLNTTLVSFNLRNNGLGELGVSALHQDRGGSLKLRPSSSLSTCLTSESTSWATALM